MGTRDIQVGGKKEKQRGKKSHPKYLKNKYLGHYPHFDYTH